MRLRIALLGLVTLLGISFDSTADVLRTKDGRMLEGRVIKQDEKIVVFEMIRFGGAIRLEFKPEEVASITEGDLPPAVTRPASPAKATATAAGPEVPPIARYNGPTYYVAPMRGQIGEAVTASLLERMLADAAERSPTAVVLLIDSPGGAVDEVEGLVEVIATYKKRLRIIVLAKSAISAAAITALAADEIFMQPTATFGAATAYRTTPDGSAVAIEEKMQSIWRAQGRSAAEVGRHSPLLAEGMIDRSIGIYLHAEAGKPVLTSRPYTSSVVVKPPGKLLTLTAREAVACGLAAAIIEDTAALGKAVGHPGWVECKGIGEPLAAWWEARYEASVKAWDAVVARLKLAMQDAEANDPAAFRDYVGPQDARSVKLWNMRANRCADALRVAEGEVLKLSRVLDEYPHIPVGQKTVQDYRIYVMGLRQRIEAARMRVPDAPKRR